MKDKREIPRALLAWYGTNRRDLPWRRRPTPYRVWISEIMLQQTQVAAVVPYYRRFLRRFPSLKRLAAAEEGEVLALWSGLGYYRRARHLHAAAREVSERYGGRFPKSLEKALTLPGIGPYTAGAILSIAYNLPVPVVDGNVERVLTRLFGLNGDPARGPLKRQLRELAESLLPAGRSSDFNQALMELGALVCTPVQPDCAACPIAVRCEARAQGAQSRFPQKAAARKPVSVHLGVAVIRSGPRVLLEYRSPEARDGPRYLRGLWNLPSVEIDRPGDARTALESYLRESWGNSVNLNEALGTVQHAITFRRITVHAWIGESDRGRVRRQREASERSGRRERHARWRWCRPDQLAEEVGVPALALKVLRLRPEGF